MNFLGLAKKVAKMATSLKVPFRQVTTGATLSFTNIFLREYRMVQRFIQVSDFHEGCRAMVEHDDGKTITVGLEEVVGQPTERPPKFVPDPVVAGPGGCRCPLCVIPIPVSYRDVLILEQFMRPDGTVLPPDFTGLCPGQQERLERRVMQAHWSHLFPDDMTGPPELDTSGWRRFQRHWDDDLAMNRTFIKVMPGSWFFIKRYNTNAGRYRKRPLR